MGWGGGGWRKTYSVPCGTGGRESIVSEAPSSTTISATLQGRVPQQWLARSQAEDDQHVESLTRGPRRVQGRQNVSQRRSPLRPSRLAETAVSGWHSRRGSRAKPSDIQGHPPADSQPASAWLSGPRGRHFRDRRRAAVLDTCRPVT